MKWTWLVVVGLLLSRAAGATDYPHSGSYAETDGTGRPLLKVNGTVDSSACYMLARGHDLITINVSPHDSKNFSVLPVLRHFGSDSLKIVAYDLVGSRWYPPYATAGTQWKRIHAAYDTMQARGVQAWLYGTDGAVWVDGYSVNLGLAAVKDTLVSVWNTYTGNANWDGWFFDYYSTDIAWTTPYTLPDPDRVMDWARAGYASAAAGDLARRTRCAAFEAGLRAGPGGNNKIMIGNGTTPVANQANWNGAMYEGWYTTVAGAMTTKINTYIANAKPYDMIKIEDTTIPYGSQWNQRARFGLGCASLAAGWFQIGPNRSLTNQGYTPYIYLIQDETSVRPWPNCRVDTTGAHKGWLGQPLEAAQNPQTGVWTRRFQNGMVVVNTSGSTYTANVAGYRRIRGLHDTTTNTGAMTGTADIPNNDALFLVKRKGPEHRWWQWWYF